MFEKAIDTVGQTHFDAMPIWLKYIDFEKVRNNLSIVNILCYMALETPMADNITILSSRYMGILNSLFEKIFESITGPDAESQFKGSPKYADKNR